jgi:hypothetical protein
MWKSALMLSVAAVVLHIEAAEAKNVMVGIRGDQWGLNRIQGICAMQKGEFYQKGDEYGCSKDCKGGTCSVSCKGNAKTGHCVGSVPAPRLAPGTTIHVPTRPRGFLAGRVSY